MLLHSFGYKANMEQSLTTKNGINLVVNLIPAILFFVSALACLLWNLSDKDTDDIRKQLDEKREKEND